MEDNTQAVQALSKKDEAYVRIKDRIISGEYKPGSLLVERTLSDSLNMSRTPIRAALMDLCHTGLATFVPGKGIYVSVIGRRDIEEIYEIRALLDPAVLLSFMKQATRDQIAMLRTFADNMRDAVRMETRECSLKMMSIFISTIRITAAMPGWPTSSAPPWIHSTASATSPRRP